jgi:para-aminobenzoate synthetase component I
MDLEQIVFERQPIVQQLPFHLTPLKVFELLKDRPFCFFLDSGMDVQRLGRYSFLGCAPFLTFQSKGDKITIQTAEGQQNFTGDPFQTLSGLLSTYRLDSTGLPAPLAGGAVGYFSYDLCHFIERLPSKAVDDLHLPECYLGFYDVVVAFDLLEEKTYIISNGFPELEETRRKLRAKARLDDMTALLAESCFSDNALGIEQTAKDRILLRSNFTPGTYMASIETARQYIIAGDIFQVNLSQRFETDILVSPYELYRRLRQINPSPFASYFDCGQMTVVSASPERFLEVKGNYVETRPIKGTRPRGSTPAEDEANARQLLSSAKDRAENIMIVDLERNDLGRVCDYGSIRVTERAILETFPTVFHLTSTVVGRLGADKDRIDLLRACFPGGSITGAPKVRAMEIIDELEPTRRSVYTGAIGYLSFSGDMDLNIAIRTILVKNGRAYFQVGGGIVYDSQPEAEYQETLDKAKALIQASKLSTKRAVEVI